MYPPVNIWHHFLGTFTAPGSVSDSQRLRRAKDGGGSVENALRAFSTLPPPLSECRRREQAIVIEIRLALKADL